ncbi:MULTISPECIES: AAA family ATPase [Mesorhizobium]|uniref:AAA family ATPase n=1 Tax=Mesorhizobium TaxID=68287 RepID=UPI0010A972A7|nr:MULTISPECIES: AAA family ATPase [Mesorhizobium]
MYLTQIELENTGPIPLLRYKLPFDENARPKPVVFVGQNGSGKSVLISHIVSALLEAKSTVFEDHEVDPGKVYKLRSSIFIRHEQPFSLASLEFTGGLFQKEIQLSVPKEEYVEKYQSTPSNPVWNNIQELDNSAYVSNFMQHRKELEKDIESSIILYFPANRFEEPSWLNQLNLQNKSNYLAANQVKGNSNRRIINYAPMRENQDWLLDVLYDAEAIERKIKMVEYANNLKLPVLVSEGNSTNIKIEIEKFFLELLGGQPPAQWNVGRRGARSIQMAGNNKVLSGNLFSLSTGQSLLIDSFLSILKTNDMYNGVFNGLAEISGIVIVDEIDVHMHTELQATILPKLVAMFPKIQFIVTCHSPIFLMGLDKILGQDGFDIIELPSGTKIDTERFAEFESAYGHFKRSVRFESDLKEAIFASHRKNLFVEGDIDISLLKRAAIALGREDALNEYEIYDANGYGGLDKIWRNFDSRLAIALNQRVVLLYDCDIEKTNAVRELAYRRVMQARDRRIKKGIENLFTDDLIQRAREARPEFFDVTPAYEKVVKGVTVPVEEIWNVNKDEKRSLANWIIENGSNEDFADFADVFNMLAELAA